MKTDPFIQQLVDSFDVWMRSGGGAARVAHTRAPYPTLFSPVRIGRVSLKNRIALLPSRDQAALNAFSKGGAGLLNAGPFDCGKADGAAALAHWQETAAAVQSAGGRLFAALSAGLGRAEVLREGRPVSVSRIPAYGRPGVLCRPLSDARLRRILQAMAQAAAAAKAAGFDGVCLCGSEGLLLDQMTNTAYHRRRIGSFANPQRFGLDLIEAIRRACGADFPILYRISLSAALGEAFASDETAKALLARLASGRTLEEALDYMEALAAAGVDAFCAELGGCETPWLAHPGTGMPAGCLLPLATLVKERLAARGVRVPVAAFGKLGNADLAEEALLFGRCDFIMLDGASDARPAWPDKARAGALGEICPGTEAGDSSQGAHSPAKRKKRIAVVGAGRAGIRFAVTAARRGHSVTLYERRDHIGGRLVPESVPKICFERQNELVALDRALASAQERFSLDVRMRCEMSAPGLAAEGFDAIVFATGARDLTPKIEGLDNIPHVQAADLLLDPALLGAAQAIVLLGGGADACETACFLACEKGRRVTMIETRPYFMADCGAAERGYLLHALKKAGVALYNCAKAVGFEGKATGFEKKTVRIVQNAHRDVPDPACAWMPVPAAPLAELPFAAKELTLEAELVVLALGRRPDEREYLAAQQLHAAPELFNIGESAAAEDADCGALRLANTI